MQAAAERARKEAEDKAAMEALAASAERARKVEADRAAAVAAAERARRAADEERIAAESIRRAEAEQVKSFPQYRTINRFFIIISIFML